MTEEPRAQTPWRYVVTFWVWTLALFFAVPRVTTAAKRVGIPAVLAWALCLFVWGLVSAIIVILSRPSTPQERREKFKSAAFLITAIVLIAVVEMLLEPFVYRVGIPAEFLDTVSWLGAIMIVGLPAEALRKRLGIRFPPNKEPAN